MTADPGLEGRLAGRRIVVTGEHGAIGSHLVRRLAAAEAHVLCLDHAPGSPHGRPPAHVRTVRCDIRCPQLPDIISAHRPDTVIHLAAQVGVPASVAQPGYDADVNIRGTIAVAEAMPEEFYGYKANPAEMSFAGLMVHIANSNQFRFAQISEDKAPAPAAPKQWTKTTIIDRLRESFDYCIGKLGTITEEQFKKPFQVDWYQRPTASGAQVLLGMYVHTAHHRAQAEVYMRANNIKPPDYRP